MQVTNKDLILFLLKSKGILLWEMQSKWTEEYCAWCWPEKSLTFCLPVAFGFSSLFRRSSRNLLSEVVALICLGHLIRRDSG